MQNLQFEYEERALFVLMLDAGGQTAVAPFVCRCIRDTQWGETAAADRRAKNTEHQRK